MKTPHVRISQIKRRPDHIDMPMNQERFEALKKKIELEGVRRPLAVTEDQEEKGTFWLLGGYNRLAICELLGLKEVPICVMPSESDPLRAMLDDNATGRSLTCSAIALMVYLYHQEELDAETSKGLQTANLRRGNSPLAKNGQRGIIGVSANSLADEYGIHKDYITLLMKLRAAVDDEGWETIKSKILQDEISVTRIVAGEGGKVQAGKKVQVQYGKLAGKAFVSIRNAFQNWGVIHPDDRTIVYSHMLSAFAVLPPDGFSALAAAVEHWPEHECRNLAKVIKAHLDNQKAVKA